MAARNTGLVKAALREPAHRPKIEFGSVEKSKTARISSHRAQRTSGPRYVRAPHRHRLRADAIAINAIGSGRACSQNEQKERG